MININNFNRVNSLELFFDFFSIYKEHINDPHDIERCYKWAGTILEDFNEIDKSYSNYSELFDYLSDVKRIENWYLDAHSNRNEINDYVAFFKSLKSIYRELAKNLLFKQVAYPGLSQRILVDEIEKIRDWLEYNKKQKEGKHS